MLGDDDDYKPCLRQANCSLFVKVRLRDLKHNNRRHFAVVSMEEDQVFTILKPLGNIQEKKDPSQSPSLKTGIKMHYQVLAFDACIPDTKCD